MTGAPQVLFVADPCRCRRGRPVAARVAASSAAKARPRSADLSLIIVMMAPRPRTADAPRRSYMDVLKA